MEAVDVVGFLDCEGSRGGVAPSQDILLSSDWYLAFFSLNVPAIQIEIVSDAQVLMGEFPVTPVPMLLVRLP